MIAKIADTRYTLQDLAGLPDETAFELADGQLVERNVSVLSSLVEGFVYDRVLDYARMTDGGLVWPGTIGYQCFPLFPDKTPRPDVSFIAKARLSKELMVAGYITIAPDLAVEVLSPNDLAYEVDQKVEEYFSVGVRVIWIINPEKRTVVIYRPNGTATKLTDKD